MDLTVKKLSINVDQLDERSTFSNGDFISGRVTLEVEKEASLQSFFIKVKGKASVMWTEHYSKYSTVVYHDTETCLRSVQHFIQDQKNQGKVTESLFTPPYTA